MGFKNWFKKRAKQNVGDYWQEQVDNSPVARGVKKGARAIDEITSEYTPTFRKWGGKAVEGTALAAGMVAGGMKRSAKGLLQLVGHGTWIFALLAAVGHAMLVLTPAYIILFTGVGDFFSSLAGALVTTEFVYYLLLALLAAVFFYRDQSDPFPLRTFLRFLVLTFFAYLIPVLIKSAVEIAGPSMQVMLKLLLLFTPLWLFFVFANPGPDEKITRFLAFIFYFAMFVVILIHIVMALKDTGYSPIPGNPLSYGDVANYIKNGFKETKSQVKSSIDQFRDGWNKQMNETVRDYYAGQVDQSQGAPLGVFVEQPQADLMKFYVSDGDDVSATALLKARTLDDRDIMIKNECFLELLDDRDYNNIKTINITGTVLPATSKFQYSGGFQDQVDIQCVIRNAEIKKFVPQNRIYSGTIYFVSTFDFKTLSYMQYAFMDRDLYVAMRRDNLNPAMEMGVKENPVAVYTPGPLMIGMARDTQPFPIIEQSRDTELPAFGVTLAPATFGKGKLVNLSELHLLVPQQFELDREKCIPGSLFNEANPDQSQLRPYDWQNPTARASAPVAWKENDHYFDYIVTDARIYADINFFTLRCPLTQNQRGLGSELRLLSPAGASLYTFYAEATYTYQSEARTAVIMMGALPTDDGTTGSSSSTTSTANTASASGSSVSQSTNTNTQTGNVPAGSTSSDPACVAISGKQCPDVNNYCWCAKYDANQKLTETCWWIIGQEGGKQCQAN